MGRKLQMKHTKKCTKKKKARLKKKKKRKREKKLGIRNRRQSYFQGRKKTRKQQGKKKDCKASTNKARIGGKQNEEDFVREGSSQPPQKWPQRASGLKFRQNLKQLVCDGDTDESSTDESDNNIWTDCEDFSDKCGVCKSINTL